MPDPAPITLHTPVRELQGVRAKQADALAALGVRNVGQLVAYLPMRHERLEAETEIDQISPDSIITTRGDITATRVSGRGPKPRFEAVLCDPTGRLDLVWFNAPYMRHNLHPGMRIRVHGEVRKFGPGIQLANARYEVLPPGNEEPPSAETRIRPVYPASEKIPSREIERIIPRVLSDALPLIEDHLSSEYRGERLLPELREAYRMMHAPETDEEAGAARRRLAYDELLMLQLGVQIKRAHLRIELRSPILKWSQAMDAHIRERFPFALTPDQDAAISDIVADVTREVPSNRLLQGDVGSGKTVVALYAMLLAVASGHQAAMMAPTELLAEQHCASISAMLKDSRVRVALLTGTLGARERAAILGRLESGDIDIVVGTHALISEDVRYHSLALAVVDEQHRFGVYQRAALRSKGGTSEQNKDVTSPENPAPPASAAQDSNRRHGAGATSPPLTPHVLVMTATPIPRTLTLTLFGDLDVSIIRSMPPGRKPIRTRLVTQDKSHDVYEFVRERLDTGDQAYIVVPAIDAGSTSRSAGAGSPPDTAAIASVESVFARLATGELAGVPIAAMHGRLTQPERERIMEEFRAGRVRALVATTVIEVGVDVPNATIMVVEGAERFGLSQLHQLRGRVGRGEKPSVCILIGDASTEEAARRLAVMKDVSDGFVIAERDFEIRGPGEVFGVRQAGLAPFKVADLMKDRDLLAMAIRDAAAWIAESPTLARPEEALVRRRLFKQHGPWIGIGDVG
ncbi:MAG: ATP-dependent DNA helicase RecG [Pyrinomonadaceae bacterium]|nr:ATP-dependent DNA helicase RecG [Phycisphaerales bacterium]